MGRILWVPLKMPPVRQRKERVVHKSAECHINFNLLHILSTRKVQWICEELADWLTSWLVDWKEIQLWISWEFPTSAGEQRDNNGLFMLMLCNQNAYDLNANKKSTPSHAKPLVFNSLFVCLFVVVAVFIWLLPAFLRIFNRPIFRVVRLFAFAFAA